MYLTFIFLWIERLTHHSCELKNLNFGGYSRRVNQSGACSSSDVITSGGRKSQTTMEDKLIWLYVGTRSCTILLRTFTKTGINLATRLELLQKPPHDANSRLLCSEFHARMKRVNVQASNYARIARFIRFIRVWCERTLRGGLLE